MTDYIKRENAKRAVWGCARDTGIDEAPFEYAEGLLEDVPSEDVAPVRHGRWIKNDPHCDGLAFLWNCSKCGAESEEGYRYCPACGARMDAKE